MSQTNYFSHCVYTYILRRMMRRGGQMSKYGNHNILFAKIQHYGIRGKASHWFRSYFSNRQQFVQYNGACSQKKFMECGVPQGSILGPLLFLLYVNDICNVSSVFHFVLFSDDTNLFYANKDLSSLSEHVNQELHKLSVWFSCNKLSINLKKTHFMIFRPRQKQCNVELDILLNNYKLIELIKEISFLGVILDEHLTWKSHISYIARKMSKSIGVKKKQAFTFLNRRQFCYIFSYLAMHIQLFQLRLSPEQSGKVEYERERLLHGNR